MNNDKRRALKAEIEKLIKQHKNNTKSVGEFQLAKGVYNALAETYPKEKEMVRFLLFAVTSFITHSHIDSDEFIKQLAEGLAKASEVEQAMSGEH